MLSYFLPLGLGGAVKIAFQLMKDDSVGKAASGKVNESANYYLTSPPPPKKKTVFINLKKVHNTRKKPQQKASL